MADLTQAKKAKRYDQSVVRQNREKRQEKTMMADLWKLGGGLAVLSGYTALTTRFPRAKSIGAEGQGPTDALLGLLLGVPGFFFSGDGAEFAFGGGFALLSTWYARWLASLPFLQA